MLTVAGLIPSLPGALRAADAVSALPYSGRPFVRTFRSRDIYSSGPVRCFAQTAEGNYFVGSDSLSVFDGSVWSAIEDREVHGIRGLAVDHSRPDSAERVWVAARTTLGYVEKSEIGHWKFVSLRAQALAAGLSAGSPFFDVASTTTGAIFATENNLIRWNGSRFESVRLRSSGMVKLAPAAGGGAWIWQADSGLLFMNDRGAPLLVRAAATLPKDPITWLLPPLPSGQNRGPGDLPGVQEFILGTANDVYELTAEGYVRLNPLSEAVRQQLPVGAMAMPAGALAIYTLNNGVVFGRRDGTVTSIVNHLNGLRDDAVHALWPGAGGESWVGVDDGCERISGLGRVSMFDAREGLERGYAERVLNFQGNTYVQTNKALYKLEPNLNGLSRLAPVLESNPGLTGAVVSGDGLWVAGYRGIWKVGSGVELTREAGQYPIEALSAASTPGDVVYVQNKQVRTLLSPAASRIPPPVEGRITSEISNSLVGLWLSTEDNFIYHYRATRAGDWELVRRYAEGNGLPDSGRLRLALAGGRVFGFTDQQILGWNGRGFLPVPELTDWIGIAGNVSDATTAYWVVCRKNNSAVLPYSLVRVRVPPDPSQPVRAESIRCLGIDTIGQVASVSVTHIAGGDWVWIGGKEGLLRMATANAEKAVAIPRAQIREVRASGDVERSLPLWPKGEAEIDSDVQHIRFYFSAAEPMDPGSELYQTRLQNIESDWGEPARVNIREFTGLGPGHYVFSVRRIDRFGNIGPASDYSFHVTGPWYSRWPANIAFGAIGLAGVVLVFRWRVTQLKARALRLDRLVAERTRALELSSVGRSEFLENISHEIRNPLNGLIGLLRLLDKHSPTPKERTIAESLGRVAAELTRIFEQVLNFSKAEYGYVQLENKPFSLATILNGSLELARESARQRNCTLRLEWPSQVEDGFEGDAAKIGAITGNLLSNAVKYAPGDITVTVSCEPTEAGASDVVIEVSDHGPGIPPEEQELIFEKFVRGSKAKREQIPGTGLGLALCRAYAQMMGGSIHVDSTPGVGSVFSVQLPLVRRALATAEILPVMTRFAVASDDALRQRVALIVEDEIYNRLILKSMVEEFGWGSQTAETVEETTRLLGGPCPDIVLLDLELPDGKGTEVARHIRSKVGLQPIVVATTGHDSDEMRAACLEAGINGFLAKPYSQEDVGLILAAAASRDYASLQTLSGRKDRIRGTGLDPTALHFLENCPEKITGVSARGFVKAVEEEIGRLERAVEQLNAAEKKLATHRLRALAGLIGCQNVREIIQNLEGCPNSDVVASRRFIADLKDGWRQARAELTVAMMEHHRA